MLSIKSYIEKNNNVNCHMLEQNGLQGNKFHSEIINNPELDVEDHSTQFHHQQNDNYQTQIYNDNQTQNPNQINYTTSTTNNNLYLFELDHSVENNIVENHYNTSDPQPRYSAYNQQQQFYENNTLSGCQISGLDYHEPFPGQNFSPFIDPNQKFQQLLNNSNCSIPQIIYLIIKIFSLQTGEQDQYSVDNISLIYNIDIQQAGEIYDNFHKILIYIKFQYHYDFSQQQICQLCNIDYEQFCQQKEYVIGGLFIQQYQNNYMFLLKLCPDILEDKLKNLPQDQQIIYEQYLSGLNYNNNNKLVNECIDLLILYF